MKVEITSENLKNLGYSLDRQYDHDEFSTAIYIKEDLIVEITYRGVKQLSAELRLTSDFCKPATLEMIEVVTPALLKTPEEKESDKELIENLKKEIHRLENIPDMEPELVKDNYLLSKQISGLNSEILKLKDVEIELLRRQTQVMLFNRMPWYKKVFHLGYFDTSPLISINSN